jgi:1-pyrroline-5-carboxylate dehydrogenase
MASAALVAGNAVVLKPSPMAGLSGSLIAECFAAGGLPDGVLNIVMGDDATGRAIVESPGIDGIAFTGSHEVGMGILRQMTGGPYARPMLGELGGKSPSYVSAKANLEDAVAGVGESAFGLQGQRCTTNSVCFVERSAYDDFVSALTERTSALNIGDPRERQTYMGPVLSEKSAARWQRAVEAARQHGRIVLGGERLAGGFYNRGAYVPPTIVVDLPDGHDLYRRELFAPFLAIRPYDSLPEAIRLGNSVDAGLAAGIFSKDAAEVDYFAENVQAGVLYANRALGATTGAWPGVQSFCGWKGSGTTGKGGLGSWYVPQFMREQCRTFMPLQRLA